MKVSIPDDLHERLTTIYKNPTHLASAVARMCEVLTLIPKGRTLTLTETELQPLESLLASGSILDGHDLVRKVEVLAEFRVGTVSITFDASDLSRLQQRAARRGWTIEAYVRLMLDRFKDEWMLIGEPVELETSAK